ncbi:MAG: hypothetical protein WD396_10120 [Pseudohongiellaceae bacterium]
MSLVNNMLRDLDQRRREAEGTASSVKLTPASDFPKPRNRRNLLLVVTVLLVMAVGLGFAWLQLGNTDTPRTLDIRPAVVGADIDAESTDLEGEPTSANGMPPQPAAADDRQTANGSPTQTAAGETPQVTNPQPVATPGNAAPTAVGTEIATAEDTTNEDAAEEAGSVAGASPGQQAPVQTEQAQARTGEEAGEQTVAGAETTTALADSGVPAPLRNLTAPRDDTPGVKDAAAMSPEMLDTLAVQKALGLIADNRMIDAYAHLEQHVIANRYAHQSRETYAKLLLNEGELLAANNVVELGLALAPNHPGFKKIKARLLIVDGQVGAAAELLASRAPAVGEDTEYHEILATAQLASRDYRGAANSYTTLVQQDRGQGRWWYGFARSQDSLGNPRAAQQAYSQALQQANLSPNLRRRSQDRLAALSD